MSQPKQIKYKGRTYIRADLVEAAPPLVHDDTPAKIPDGEDYDEVVSWLAAVDEKELIKEMNKTSYKHWLFPSGWHYVFDKRPYPLVLAKALVKSKSNESINDIANVYYAGRKCEAGVLDLFKADCLKNIGEQLEFLYMGNAPSYLLEDEPAFLKKYLQLLSDKQVKQFEQGMNEDYGHSITAEDIYKKLKLKFEPAK